MSDDLVKRYSSYNIMMLGDSGNEVSTPDGEWVKYKDYHAQSARIEELEAELEQAEAQIAEIEEQRNFTQGLVLKLDAKLAKATDTLARVARGDDDAHNWAIWTIAELKGEQQWHKK